MLILEKKIKWAVLLVILAIFLLLVYFLSKFFPTQKGSWESGAKISPNNAEIMPTSGWTQSESTFWINSDFAGQQKICLKIKTKGAIPNKSLFTIPVQQTSRAGLYPKSGSLADLFNAYSSSTVAEDLKQNKPFLLGGLENDVKREEKSLFLVTDKEKFLFPTQKIFSDYFPQKTIPGSEPKSTDKEYSNILIFFPEGVLLSDGKGVFAVSNRKIFLIKSPQVFEALGYSWDKVQQMDTFEIHFNPFKSGNVWDFEAIHPNGTVIKNSQGELFLVWQEKLYSLNSDEKARYFLFQPEVAISEKDLSANCEIAGDSVNCCLDKFDSRLNPPQFSPFAGTTAWDLSKLGSSNIAKIDWQSKIILNRENIWNRLNSLKQFLLYSLGILK